MVVISDGVPTVALRHRGDPYTDAIVQARAAGRDGIYLVVVDTTDKPGRQRRCGPALAEAGGGTWLRFDEVVPEAFGEALDTAAGQRRSP
jgi:Mg-chelatase subunit ChlD